MILINRLAACSIATWPRNAHTGKLHVEMAPARALRNGVLAPKSSGAAAKAGRRAKPGGRLKARPHRDGPAREECASGDRG